MRVLYWADLFWPYVGGAEQFGATLVPALQQRGHEVIVVTSHHYLDLPNQGRHKGIPIYRFPFRQGLQRGDAALCLEARKRVASLKRSFKPDVIHLNALGPSALFHLQTVDAHAAPVLVRINTDLFGSEGELPNTLTGQILHRADWITCVSNATLTQVHRWLPQISDRTSVIYNSVDIPRAPSPLPTDPPRLLCLGRLIPEKGFDVALAALALLIDRFPDLRLVVAGDGPERAALEHQAAELGISQSVEFIGWIEPEQVPAILDQATAVVLPSRREGLPMVALEAALMARPVVATRTGGIPEVIVHEETGLLVDKDDSRGLATSLALLLAEPERAAAMGQAAYRHARSTFSSERCVQSYLDLYQRLINDSPRRTAPR